MPELMPANADGDSIIFGDGTPDQFQISIQGLQGIYHELTGKSEEISKNYKEPYRIEFNDIVQLNHQITQICEQYQIRASNFSATVFYVNDTKEQFSSFERFQIFNAGSSSPVESILLTYDFLILLPQVNKPQTYKLEVRLASQVAVQNKMRSDMFNIPKVIRIMGGTRTAMVSITYVDYAVARNVLHTVDEWFKSLKRDTDGAFWLFLQRHSDYIPLLMRYAAALAASIVIVDYSGHFLSQKSTLKDLGVYVVVSLTSLFAVYKLAHHMGSAAEDSVDGWSQLGWLCLTEGDKREVEAARARAKSSKLWACIKAAGALSMSIVSKVAAVIIAAHI
jgi:hypothetical protein